MTLAKEKSVSSLIWTSSYSLSSLDRAILELQADQQSLVDPVRVKVTFLCSSMDQQWYKAYLFPNVQGRLLPRGLLPPAGTHQELTRLMLINSQGTFTTNMGCYIMPKHAL